MLKKGDDVMFWFIAGEVVVRGRGEVHRVEDGIIRISWYGNRITSITPENVFPFDNDKYSEMKNDSAYTHKLGEATETEITRLQKICIGD